jgi:hypothetical protein
VLVTEGRQPGPIRASATTLLKLSKNRLKIKCVVAGNASRSFRQIPATVVEIERQTGRVKMSVGNGMLNPRTPKARHVYDCGDKAYTEEGALVVGCSGDLIQNVVPWTAGREILIVERGTRDEAGKIIDALPEQERQNAWDEQELVDWDPRVLQDGRSYNELEERVRMAVGVFARDVMAGTLLDTHVRRHDIRNLIITVVGDSTQAEQVYVAFRSQKIRRLEELAWCLRRRVDGFLLAAFSRRVDSLISTRAAGPALVGAILEGIFHTTGQINKEIRLNVTCELRGGQLVSLGTPFSYVMKISKYVKASGPSVVECAVDQTYNEAGKGQRGYDAIHVEKRFGGLAVTVIEHTIAAGHVVRPKTIKDVAQALGSQACGSPVLYLVVPVAGKRGKDRFFGHCDGGPIQFRSIDGNFDGIHMFQAEFDLYEALEGIASKLVAPPVAPGVVGPIVPRPMARVQARRHSQGVVLTRATGP